MQESLQNIHRTTNYDNREQSFNIIFSQCLLLGKKERKGKEEKRRYSGKEKIEYLVLLRLLFLNIYNTQDSES